MIYELHYLPARERNAAEKEEKGKQQRQRRRVWLLKWVFEHRWGMGGRDPWLLFPKYTQEWGGKGRT